jgi:hypothetical protein
VIGWLRTLLRIPERDDGAVRCTRHLDDGRRCPWWFIGDTPRVRAIQYHQHLIREHGDR